MRFLTIILLYTIIITNIYRKNDFAEVSKKVKYRSENYFWTIKIIIEESQV